MCNHLRECKSMPTKIFPRKSKLEMVESNEKMVNGLCCMKKKFGEKGISLCKKKGGGVQKRRRQYLDFICDIISILGYEIYNFIFTWNQQLFPIHNQLIIMHPHPPTPKIFL